MQHPKRECVASLSGIYLPTPRASRTGSGCIAVCTAVHERDVLGFQTDTGCDTENEGMLLRAESGREMVWRVTST